MLSCPLSGVGLDLLLQSLHWVSFDNLFRWFRSNFDVFPKDVPHSCLRGWLVRILSLQSPGSVKMPVFFTSWQAIVTKESRISEHAFCFSSCCSANALVIAPLVM